MNLIEMALPSTQIPGVKLGLANIVTLIVMYTYGEKDAFTLVLIRILLVSLLIGSFLSPTFAMSLTGGMVAFSMMFIAKKTKLFSMVGVSVFGALGHATGQILAAIFFLQTPELIYYWPFIFVLSIPTGLFTGLVANKFITKYDNIFDLKKLNSL
jgi:heptaprenyl diphosphate synthase